MKIERPGVALYEVLFLLKNKKKYNRIFIKISTSHKNGTEEKVMAIENELMSV